jgi:predicted secreted protein
MGGRRASESHNLAIAHPDLAAQFHPTRNGSLTPSDVVAGTRKKLWWKCPKGPDHEWQATGDSRLRAGSSCPVCSGNKVTVSNSLAAVRPDLAADFHPTRNGILTSADVVAGTGKNLWWKCPNGPDHEWQATGANRLKGSGCPVCAGRQMSLANNLAVTRPDLAAQWHPTKNGDLMPTDVIAGTAKKLWWKCPNGSDHEWQATGNSRIGGSGCPVCAGRQVTATSNMAVTRPDLADEFHPTKNAPLTAADVVAGTAKRLWWKCPKGPDHEWQVTGNSRVGGTGCPACAGQQVSVTNSLANHPALAAQFDLDRNGGLTPADVAAGTHRRIWWRCPKGPDHAWQTTGHARLYFPGCPFCIGQRVSVTNNLSNYPELAAQFHPTKNDDLTPSDVVAGTGKKLWWKCPEGSDHEWQATGAARVNGAGCPACAGAMVSVTNDLNNYPELAAQFHPTKNDDLTPSDVVAGTGKKLWWKCPQAPDHGWQATGANRLAGTGCPACRGQQVSITNSLASYPNLVAQFHPTKNGGLTPAEVLAGSTKKLWWKCPDGPDHEWAASGRTRVNGHGCPACSGSQASVTNNLNHYPELAAEFHPTKNGDLMPTDVIAGTAKNIWWQCQKDPRHEWRATGNSRTGGSGCPSCAKTGFDPSKQGWLYLLSHSTWDLLQIGITNDPRRRLATHEQSGWNRLGLRGPMDGSLTRAWEVAILNTLSERGVVQDATTAGGKFDGYTESWPREACPVRSLRELMDLVEDSEMIGDLTPP